MGLDYVKTTVTGKDDGTKMKCLVQHIDTF